MTAHRVSARALAEFAHEHGDLVPVLRAAERMQEGVKAHRARQEQYPEGMECEAFLTITAVFGDVRLTVQGRADGASAASDPPLLEEIKSTRRDVASINEDDMPEHAAQAEIYAHILAQTRGLPRVLVRLIYIHPSGEEKIFEHLLSAETLARRFEKRAAPYAHWLASIDEKREKTLCAAKPFAFPFDEYRSGQREMAAAAYRAIRDKQVLLAEAPTGIGKTMAALFAAVKALGEGLTSRVFYLTARTTQRLAAEKALSRMRARGLFVRSITLTAKDKLCPVPGVSCDPISCPYLQGFFDKRRQALYEALSVEALTRESLLSLAARHEICPFEFQLDASETADVIIGDYNYAFDPRVKLKRFFTEKSDACLLVDEAHNLIDRAREMRSATVVQKEYASLLRACKKVGAAALLPALEGVVRAFKDLTDGDRPREDDEAPETLTEALDIFIEAARPFLGGSGAIEKALTDRYFEAQNFLRVAGDMGGDHRALYEPEGKSLTVRLWCHNPGPYLKRCFARVGGVLLFSATLTPAEYYRDMLGLDADAGDRMMCLPSPFPAENLLTLTLPVDTRFKAREETAGQVARALLTLARAKTGNYLACFPSHAYLNLVAGYAAAEAGSDVTILKQEARMDDAAREAFLERLVDHPQKSLLAFVAMGGVFAEGIDLPGERLSGAAIVGVGMPQLSFERYVLSTLLDEEGEGTGARYAYVYPGLQRVLQAAGRVIRTENDRGCVLLIDERFTSPEYQSLLPPHWNPKLVKTAEDADRALRAFWRKK